MKQTTAFQRLRFAIYREWAFAKRYPAYFVAGASKSLLAFSLGYCVTWFMLVMLLGLAAMPSCTTKRVDSATIWQQAYERGYAERFETPNGDAAYRWKEGVK